MLSHLRSITIFNDRRGLYASATRIRTNGASKQTYDESKSSRNIPMWSHTTPTPCNSPLDSSRTHMHNASTCTPNHVLLAHNSLAYPSATLPYQGTRRFDLTYHSGGMISPQPHDSHASPSWLVYATFALIGVGEMNDGGAVIVADAATDAGVAEGD